MNAAIANEQPTNPPAVSHPIAELIRYYDRVAADPKRSIAPLGFSVEKIHACMVIDLDGGKPKLEDIRIAQPKGKPIHREMTLPDSGGRSGTSIQPNFLWDNTGYVLGRDNKGKRDRAEQCFEAFRGRHHGFAERLNGIPEFMAVIKFLDAWNPADSESLNGWEDLQGLNVAFQIRGQQQFVHEVAEVQHAWMESVQAASAAETEFEEAPSFFDGQIKRLARLHPQVQGVVGANTSGAAMVSFNKSAFESYGKSKSYNSPLGETEAFKYTTSLQQLLSDRSRRFGIGDATVVFWTDSPKPNADEDAKQAIQIFAEPIPPKKDQAEHLGLIGRLKGFLKDARRGVVSDHVHDPDANFYLLGLSPSTSRLSIRYWMTGTVQELASRLQSHLDDMAIIGLDENRLPFSRAVAYETARDAKEISPVLAGEILRSILNNAPYPASLMPAVVRRCRVEQNVRSMQAAILKACFNRQQRTRTGGRPLPESLEPDYPSSSYQIGRVAAVLDAAHLASTGGRIKESAARSRMGGICSNPMAGLVPLLTLNSHHLSKIPTDAKEARRLKIRTRATYAGDLQDAMSRLDSLPHSLTVDQQSKLLVGFYHQNQFTFRSSQPRDTKESLS